MLLPAHPDRHVERLDMDVGEAELGQATHRPGPPPRLRLGAREPLADLGGDALDEVPGDGVAVQRRVAQLGGAAADALGGREGGEGEREGERAQLFHGCPLLIVTALGKPARRACVAIVRCDLDHRSLLPGRPDSASSIRHRAVCVAIAAGEVAMKSRQLILSLLLASGATQAWAQPDASAERSYASEARARGRAPQSGPVDLLPLMQVDRAASPTAGDSAVGGYVRFWAERMPVPDDCSRDYHDERRAWLSRWLVGRSRSRILQARILITNPNITSSFTLAATSQTSNRSDGENFTSELGHRRFLTPYVRVRSEEH